MNKSIKKRFVQLVLLLTALVVAASCVQPFTNQTASGISKNIGAWDAARAYSAGDRVTYNGYYWNAKWWSQGEEPGTVEWGAWEQDGITQPETPTVTITPTSTPTVTITPTPTIMPYFDYTKATTKAAANVDSYSATISGECSIVIQGLYRNTFSAELNYWVQGDSTNKILAASSPANQSFPKRLSADLTGLLPDTTYEFQFKAIGESSPSGSILTFTTLPMPTVTPTVTATPRFILYKSVTYPAENVTETSAYISGATEILPGGGSEGPDISAELYYWEKGNSENKILAANIPFTYQLPVSLGANLTGLIPNTTYEFAFTTNNSSGHTPSNPLSFTTFAEEPPPTPTATATPAYTQWNAASTYLQGDMVIYEGAVYKAKWWTQGEVPGSNEWGAWEIIE